MKYLVIQWNGPPENSGDERFTYNEFELLYETDSFETAKSEAELNNTEQEPVSILEVKEYQHVYPKDTPKVWEKVDD